MEFGKLTLIVILSICSVRCFPSRPLNDRPGELDWQAWLLVDAQNQLQNESDRRITPKSVFIAPKLDPRNDSLPDCPEGYRPDSMGRCIKFIKVDEAAHLDFLLKRLNEMYADQSSEEIEESDESLPTAGPLQVNIPLGQLDDSDSKSDIEIVVAPTNGQFDDKVNVKRHPDIRPLETVKPNKPNTEQVEIPPVSEEDYYYDDESTDENDTTTTTTTQTEQTTTDFTTETITIPTTEETTTTETTEASTTILTDVEDDGLKALFFLMPSNNTAKKNTTDNPPLHKEVSSEVALVTFKEDTPEPHLVEIHAPFEQHKLSNLKFPDDDKTVKFPETTDPNQKNDFLIDRTKVYYSNPVQHKPHSSELTPEQIQAIFKQYVHRPSTYVDQHPTHDRVFNHRNRDRNEDLWSLTPTLREDKPLVARFGRYPSSYYPSQGLYNPKHHSLPHHEVQYYGEETGQDYSNIYGRKRRRGNLR